VFGRIGTWFSRTLGGSLMEMVAFSVPGLPKVMLHLSAVAISFGHGAGNYKFK
jgi:hypothetical protein